MADQPTSDGAPLASEDDLFELFRGHAPDPTGFRAGVDRKIDEGDVRAKASTFAPGIWRRVASIVPLEPVTGSAGAGALAKAFGGKLIPAAVLMPALIVAAVMGAFSLGARDLKRSIRGANNDTHPLPTTTDPQLPSWLKWSPLAFILLVLALRNTIGADLLVGLLLGCMVSIAWLVRGLGARGALRRSEVARMASGLFATVLGSGFAQTVQVPINSGSSALGFGPAILVFLGGWIILECSRPDFGKARAAFVLAMALVMTIGFNVVGVTHSSAAGLRSTVERIDLDPRRLSGWDAAAAGHRALAAVGADLPGYGNLRERVVAEFAEEGRISPAVRSATVDMGLMTAAEWHALDPDGIAALSSGHRIDLDTADSHRHRVPEWMAQTDVTDGERSALRTKIKWSLPEDRDVDALSSFSVCVQGLGALGYIEDVEALGPWAAELLEQRFVRPRDVTVIFGTSGGFSALPNRSYTSRDQTLAAVELMGRFGVPEGVDIYGLRGFLRNEARTPSLAFDPMPHLRAESRAALLRLEEEIGMPKRSWLGTIFAERMLIAAVLTVLLALLAVHWSPRDRDGDSISHP